MAVIWRVDVYNRALEKVAEIDDYSSASVRQLVNNPGGYAMPMWYASTQGGVNPKVKEFQKYGLVDFWRRDAALGLPWHREKTCRILAKRFFIDDQGRQIFTSSGLGLLSLLNRTINYPAGSAEAEKTGASDVIMCEFVRENAGDLATIANGRRAHGVIPALDIAVPSGLTAVWEGARAGKRLIDVLQEIADFSGVDFDIDFDAQTQRFTFRTYPGQRGVDRSNIGLDPLTGANAAGNPPTIFSPELGNMALPEYIQDSTGEITRVTVLGPDTGSTRQYDVVEAYPFAADGFDVAEATRDARNEPNSAARVVIGGAVLAQRQMEEAFEFEPIQTEGCAYGLLAPPLAAFNNGKFYWFGDRIVAQAFGITRVKRIIGVQLSVAESGGDRVEVPKFTMQDVPT